MGTTAHKVKATAKDFFIYIATMAALYASVIGFLFLVFALINTYFPDPLEGSYAYNSVKEQMRFFAAVLIIIFPTYIVLTRIVNKAIRADDDIAHIAIRKWLLALTLLISGATLVIDLIALVYGFLEGDITMRFILKVATVFLIVGVVFYYYLLDFKGKWEKNEKTSIIFGVVASIIVLAVLILAFFNIGSPETQRQIRADEERVRDLTEIQWHIRDFWVNTERLPNSLSELSDPLIYVTVPADPETGESYEYRLISPLSFELCATFNKASEENTNIRMPVYDKTGFEEGFIHSEGRNCFERTINPERLKPQTF